MTGPVAVLALLAFAGGWLEVAGLWHPFSRFLEEVAPTALVFSTTAAR